VLLRIELASWSLYDHHAHITSEDQLLDDELRSQIDKQCIDVNMQSLRYSARNHMANSTQIDLGLHQPTTPTRLRVRFRLSILPPKVRAIGYAMQGGVNAKAYPRSSASRPAGWSAG
jgi:hypothetical protein